jgi:TraM recognition site of TraD and TraG
VERRADNSDGKGRPLFIWADECQHFASRYDPLFQATARSSRAAGVYLTQSYPTLASAFGAGAEARALTDSLLGNMGTKVFHANSDAETNRFAAELVGKRMQSLRTSGAGSSFSVGGHPSFGSSSNRGRSEHMDYEIQPGEFSTLRKGGPENGYAADALVFQNGRIWGGTGRTWRKIAFRQRPVALGWAPAQPATGRSRAR